jgi:hypothetical protein
MASTIIKQPRTSETIKQIFITISVVETLRFTGLVAIVLKTYMISRLNTTLASPVPASL